MCTHLKGDINRLNFSEFGWMNFSRYIFHSVPCYPLPVYWHGIQRETILRDVDEFWIVRPEQKFGHKVLVDHYFDIFRRQEFLRAGTVSDPCQWSQGWVDHLPELTLHRCCWKKTDKVGFPRSVTSHRLYWRFPGFLRLFCNPYFAPPAIDLCDHTFVCAQKHPKSSSGVTRCRRLQ